MHANQEIGAPIFFREEAPGEITTRALALRAETINEEERSVEAVLSTETPAMVYDWRAGGLVEEILVAGGALFGDQVPMLENHYRYSLDSVLGSIRNIRVENNQVLGRLVFAKGHDGADRAWNMVKQKHLTDVSVGYAVREYTDLLPGEKKTINGKEYQAGTNRLRVSTSWKLKEGSLVPIGADERAKIRSELGLTGPQFNRMEESAMKLTPMQRAYLVSLGMKADATDAEAQEFFNKRSAGEQEFCRSLVSVTTRAEADPAAPASSGQPAAEPARSAAPATPSAPAAAPVDAEAIRTAERERLEFIRTHAATVGAPEELVQRAITENWTTERAGREFLVLLQGQRTAPVSQGAPAVHVVPEVTRQALMGAMLQRCGVADFALKQQREHAAERQALEQALDRGSRMSVFSMFDVCREVCRITGARDPYSGGVPTTQEGYIRAAVSGGTLAYIFGSSVNMVVAQAYGQQEDTSDWVAVEEVTDFKLREEIDPGINGGLERIGPGGEAKHIDFSDKHETWRIYRFAKQGCLDEMDIINDSLNVLTQTPAALARAAARVKADLVYAILMANPSLVADGVAIFDNAHGNLAGAALSAAALKAGITAMAAQTWNGETLNLSPSYLIIAPTLRWTAMELLQSTGIVIAGTAGAVTERGNLNVLGGAIANVRSEARLEVGVTDPVTGTAYAGAATKWFLAAAPTSARTIKVGYRTGTQKRPVVRAYTLDRGRWGIGWDINLDIGAAGMDYRGMYKGNN